MSKREKRAMIRGNRRQLYLEEWTRRKAAGMALSEFCRLYGLCRKSFYLWLAHGRRPRPERQRADPALKRKAIEIFVRYKGTWGPETISLALSERLSPSTIRRVVAPYRDLFRREARSPVSSAPAQARASRPNDIWSTDWTECSYGGKKAYLWLIIDEATRLCLSWELLDRVPTATDVSQAFRRTLDRYQGRPVLLKSDRAKVFRSSEWRQALEAEGIFSRLARPGVPQDQGVVERFIREIKGWLAANQPGNRDELEHCVSDGMRMLNFLKPRRMLEGRTPAQAYWSHSSCDVQFLMRSEEAA